ncbi:MAG: GntR family transcriptional regulator [Chitinivibrionales bacterium]|nr:GntR family transcriptional regulator [Chitinivibrionales bacterium]
MQTAGRSEPPLSRAVQSLDKRIAALSKSADKRLPSQIELAHEAGVSPTTMAKALSHLKAAGKISCIRGWGIYVRPDAKAPAGASHHSLQQQPVEPKAFPALWKKIADKIEHDIISNKYPGKDRLPILKEMQYRYGVSAATLKKALHSLESRGIIVPQKKGYMVPQISSELAYKRIVLLIALDHPSRQFFKESQTTRYIRAVEVACNKANIGITVISSLYEEEHDAVEYYQPGTKKKIRFEDADDVLGYVISRAGRTTGLFERHLRHVIHFKKPVGILDFEGTSLIAVAEQYRKYIGMFTLPVDKACAHDVARFAIKKGHTHCAFISPYHKYSWSKERYKECQRLFDIAGKDHRLTLFSLPLFENTRTSFEQAEKFFSGKSIENAWRKWQQSAPVAYRNHLDSMFSWILHKSYGTAEVLRQTAPLFEKALSDHRITCWITANDIIAMGALDFLAARVQGVPDDISIISFDDSVDAVEKRLTSFNFNVQGAVNAMINFITGRNIDYLSRRGNRFTIEGFIIDRNSVKTLR